MKKKKIVKANITHISFVPKGANGSDFLIVKDEENTPDLQVESPIIKVDDEQRLVTGIVYEPNKVDSQGEFMEADAIEKAAHEFMANYRNTDIKHNFVANKNVDIVESYVAKADTQIENTTIAKGTWVITTKVNDDALWQDIKKGTYKGFSMGGTGVREEVEESVDTVTKDEKGLFSLLKSYFLGDVQKAEAKPKFLVDFKARALNEKFNEIHWSLRDAIKAILTSTDPINKKELVAQQIDEYKAYVLQEMDSAGIKKMCDELEEEPVEKAGKAISAANADKIKAAYESLGAILAVIGNINEKAREEEEMKKEDLVQVVKEAVKPLVSRVDALEKSSDTSIVEKNTNASITKEDIQEVIKAAIEPLSDRISVIEKSRGISRQLPETEVQKEQKKSFEGLQI